MYFIQLAASSADPRRTARPPEGSYQFGNWKDAVSDKRRRLDPSMIPTHCIAAQVQLQSEYEAKSKIIAGMACGVRALKKEAHKPDESHAWHKEPLRPAMKKVENRDVAPLPPPPPAKVSTDSSDMPTCRTTRQPRQNSSVQDSDSSEVLDWQTSNGLLRRIRRLSCTGVCRTSMRSSALSFPGLAWLRCA